MVINHSQAVVWGCTSATSGALPRAACVASPSVTWGVGRRGCKNKGKPREREETLLITGNIHSGPGKRRGFVIPAMEHNI